MTDDKAEQLAAGAIGLAIIIVGVVIAAVAFAATWRVVAWIVGL